MFPLQGRFDLKRLPLPYRLIMKVKKVLSIPAAPEDFDALVAEGRTPEEVRCV